MKVLKWMVIGIAITVGTGQPVYAGCDDPAGPGVDWSGCDFSGKRVEGSPDNYISLNGANLTGATFDLSKFYYVDFSGANLAKTIFQSDGSSVFTDVLFSFEQVIGNKSYYGDPTTLTVVNGDRSYFSSGLGGTADIKYVNEVSGEILIGNVAPKIALEDLVSTPSGSAYRINDPITSNTGVKLDTLSNAVNLNTSLGVEMTGNDPYWQIELGVEGVFYYIEEVIIHTNTSEAKYDKGLENSLLMITDWGDVGSADSPPFGKQPLLQQNFDLISRYQIDSTVNKNVIKVGRTGRFIRIQKLGKSAELAFKEIEVIVRAIPRPNSSPKPDGFVLKACGVGVSNGSELFDESKLINDPKCSAAAGSDYSYCDLKGKSFANASFPVNANFDFADLRGVDFSGASLEEATLIGANLSGADLSGAYLYNADAKNADFREVTFSNTDVTDMSNAEACFSADIDANNAPALGLQGWTIKPEEGVPFYRPSIIDNSAGYERQSSIDNQGIAQYATDTHDTDAPTSTETVATELGAWWSLDIGGVYRIDELAISLNEDKCTNCENLVLWMSDWPIPEAELKSDTAPDFVTTYSFSDDTVNDGSGNFTFDLKKTARYLVIKLPSNQQGPLSITNVDFSGSSTPVVPDTSPPIPDDKKTELESASGLRADLDNLNKELTLFESDLDELDDTTSEAIEKTNKIKRLDSRLNKLNKALKNAEKLSERLQVIPPFKSKAVKLKSIVSKTQKVVQKVYDVVHPLEVDVAEPVRKKLISVQKKALQGSNGTNALLSYTKRGLGLVNNALNCSINDSSVDTAAVNLFGTTTDAWVAPIELGRVVIGGVDYYQKDVIVDTDSPLDNDVGMDVTVNTIDVIISQVNQQLTLGEIDALDIQLSLLEDEFYPFYGFLEALNSALSINIDVGLFEFSIADILDGIGSIPFLGEFEAIAYGIIQPILDEISKLLPATDLPSINLPNFPDIDLVAIPQFNFKIPSIEKRDLDFFELTLPTFPQCAALIQPEMKPSFYEDLDGDGLINGAETVTCSQRQVGEDSCLDADPITGYNPGTNNYPFTATLAGNADSDLDGMSDYFEVIYGLTPNDQDDASIDSDGDGLTNLDEYLYGTNPNSLDSDSDQLPDQWEVMYNTVPAAADKGIVVAFDPNNSDGTLDFDLDGLSNSVEYANGLNPFMKDSDADNLPDGYELTSNCAALSVQLSALDATDAAADFDNDRLLNITEYQNGTDICSADTDGDGLPDGGEINYGMDPLDGTEDMSADTDGDGLNILQEYARGTDINSADTDGDGRADNSDELPNDKTEWLDFDQDGFGNNKDQDDDNDGVNDSEDAFPFNGAESVDTDGDGIGNNADPDDDNDGVEDEFDPQPLNPKAGDTEAPVIGAAEEKTIEATAKLMSIVLEAPVVTDNSSLPITLESSSLEGLALGSHVITWTATDYAGNQTTMEQVVNIVDTTAPTIEGANTQKIHAAGDYTDITSALDVAVEDAVDEGIKLQIEQGTVLLSGRHQLNLFAIDESGNRTDFALELDILPRIMLQERAVVFPRSAYSLPVVLNGKAPQYPVDVNLELLLNGVSMQRINAQLDDGEQSTVSVNIPENATTSDELLLKVVNSANAYFEALERTELIVDQGNTPPIATVSFYQGGRPVSFVQPNKGTVELKTVISDTQTADSYQVDWVSSQDILPNLEASDIYSFESDGLTTGPLAFEVIVSELNTTERYSVKQNISIEVIAPSKLSDTEDTDGDGIFDSEEGYSDTDEDGIVDYLDNDPATFRLKVNASDFMKVKIGQKLMLGSMVQSKELADKPTLSMEHVIDIGVNHSVEGRDSGFERVSDIFNFRISSITSAEMGASIVIPLDTKNPLPDQARYRKFSPSKGWYDFIESDGSSIESSARDNNGNCPDINSSVYISGLVEGATCIRLTIVDGGSNDIDNLVNGIVEDPGAIVVVRENNAPTISFAAHSSQLDENQRLVLTAVAEDAEQDSITYEWKQVSGPQVEFIGDVNASFATIMLPEVTANSSVVISVNVSDGALTSSAETTVTIVNQVVNTTEERQSSGGALYVYLLMLIGILCFSRRLMSIEK